MFLYRLKTEFAANLKLVLALWLALGVGLWLFFDWWSDLGNLQGNYGHLGVFAILAVLVIVTLLVFTMFKRDDLKHPQAFWATRPIPSFTFFGAKLVFLVLAVVLPVGVASMVPGFVTGLGGRAIWHGVEAMLWAASGTSLLALSCMAYPGTSRAALCALAFIGSVILAFSILLNIQHVSLHSCIVDRPQFQWNVLVVLLLLTAGFIWQNMRQIRDKHLRQKPLLFAVAGLLAVLLVTFVPLPGGLKDTVKTTSGTTLPKVTKAQADESYIVSSRGDGPASLDMEITLLPDQPVSDGNLRCISSDIRVARGDGEVLSYAYEVSRSNNPTLTYSMSTKQPATLHMSRNKNLDPEKRKIINSLPRKTIRLTGTVEMEETRFRTIHRNSLDRLFAVKDNALRVALVVNPAHMVTDHSVLWKEYRPSFLTTFRRDEHAIRVRVLHPASPGEDLHRDFGGITPGNRDIFGGAGICYLDISAPNIKSTSYFRELQERGYKKSAQQWREEAELIIEVADEVRTVILPVDVEVEVPDPEKVWELLLKGDE